MKNTGARKEQKRTATGTSRSWIRPVLLIALALLLLPVMQTGCVRWINPPLTPLMLVRKAEAYGEKKSPAPIQYQWCSIGTIPRDFLRTTLIAEDQRFFQHEGFDWKEVRAAQRTAERTGKPVRGASTISMQCARSLFLWQGRSWLRKGLEVYYTFWLETLVPKRRILELYANVVEMGDGVYGIGAAAHAHFDTDIHRLSRDQCVRLAALLPAPLVWTPKKPSPRYAKRIERLSRSNDPIPGWQQLQLSSR